MDVRKFLKFIIKKIPKEAIEIAIRGGDEPVVSYKVPYHFDVHTLKHNFKIESSFKDGVPCRKIKIVLNSRVFQQTGEET